MSRRENIMEIITAAGRPMWCGEISDAMGIPFSQMENVRASVNALVLEGRLSRKNGRSHRVYYSLVEEKP